MPPNSRTRVAPRTHRRRVSLGLRLLLPLGLTVVAVAGIGAVTLVSQRGADPTTSATIGAPSATAAPTAAPISAAPTMIASRPPTSAAPSSGCAAQTCAAPGAPPAPAASGKRWQLKFAEEFNGSGYSKAKLTPCFDWNYGGCTNSFNDGREHYQPSQVKVSNGTAKLIAAPMDAMSADGCQDGRCTYKSGLLSTARANADGGKYLYTFTYGYVESRLKFPATRGFFTAFWMLPADPSYNYRTEIDILELLGDDPTTMFMTYNYNNRTDSYAVNNAKGNNGACPAKNYGKGFVRMGVDWQRDHISWYIDGKKCATFTGRDAIEDGPMQIILNLMVDVEWQRRWGVGLADPSLTRQLEVDYLRVYQQVPA